MITNNNVCMENIAKKKKRPFISYTIFALSDEQIKKLYSVCERMSDYIMILLAIRYGFRREDIVDIKINNIDTKGKTLTYHENKKNKDRTIPLESDVVQELVRYIGTIDQKKQRGYLFPFHDGTTAWRRFQDLCYAADIAVPVGRTGRPFHSLRGTCVKLRQAQGWTLNEVSALIGDDPETVAIHYSTVTLPELANKMNKEGVK